jgi:sterol 3beta-glucosyltransferase
MKIVVPTIGSRGDIQPYIALCQRLKKAGHNAVLATHPGISELAKFYGVDYAPIGPDVDMACEAAKIRASSRYWLISFVRVLNYAISLYAPCYPDVLALCKDAALIIVTDSGVGNAEADTLGLPRITVTLQPLRVPAPDLSPPLLKRLLNAVLGPIFGMAVTYPINRFRKRVGAPRWKPSSALEAGPSLLQLIPVSPQVVAPDPRWAPVNHLTGYWFAEEPGEWVPPASLQAFLESGARPVVITFGAMSIGAQDAQQTAELVLTAVRLAGVRAVIQGWSEILSSRALPDTIYPAGSIPHGWLLARASAIAHHGGFGTTASGLRAGIPAIVVPHILDQFYWGQRVQQCGAGPTPIPRNQLTADKLAQALRQATSDPQMRQRAAEIGAAIRAEDGLGQAAQLIEDAVKANR